VRAGLLALGVAFAVGAEWTRLRSGWPAWWIVTDGVSGIAFLLAGHVAWARRPDTRIGPLMTAIGFAWFIGTWQASPDPVVSRLSYAFPGYYDPLLAWLVLAYPTGQLRSMSARVVIAAFFAVLAVRTVMRLALFRLSTDYDLGDAAGVDRYIADLSLRDAVDTGARVAIAMLAVAILGLIAARLVRERGLGRRLAGPMLLGGLAFAVGIVAEFGAVASARSAAERITAWDVGLVITSASGTLVAIAFGFGVVRSRLGRGAVADLVVELGDDPRAPGLRETVARALGDPSLELGQAEGDGFVDAGGAPLAVPPLGDAGRAATILRRGGAAVGVLVHDPAVLEQPELLRGVAAAAALAVENERLAAEVRSQLHEVEASRARIVAAGDAERRRVERDLHDGAQQRLVTLALTLEMARSGLDGSSPGAAAILDRARQELELGLSELRELARGLHPTVLTEAGLGAAVEVLAERSRVPVRASVPDRRFPGATEAAAYFVVAEALTNVHKYAEARSIEIAVREEDGAIQVEVRDDGRGGADPATGTGLRGLADRVAAAGGQFEVESPLGGGTTVRARIPCA
jgi:signal transduction histidine kinase